MTSRSLNCSHTKEIIRIIATVVIIINMTGCASTKGYFADRLRDAKDPITVGVGAGGGAKVRLGPVQAGIITDFPLAYLRGGEFGTIASQEGTGHCMFLPDGDFDFIWSGSEGFSSTNPTTKQRRKVFRAETDRIPFVYNLQSPNPAYYSQIEIAGGILGTIRIGFNPGELLDFILGWMNIDIYNDDTDAIKPQDINDHKTTY
jgi:hypothetical protein